jgi:hypothetical protein
LPRPSLRDSFVNFGTYEASLRTKIRLLVVNNASKWRRRSNCCGHLGEPGC